MVHMSAERHGVPIFMTVEFVVVGHCKCPVAWTPPMGGCFVLIRDLYDTVW